MPRILFLTDTFPPNLGGWEHSAEVLADAAAAAGHSVIVLTPRSNHTRAAEAKLDSSKNYRVVRSRPWKTLFDAGGSRNPLLNRIARAAVFPLLIEKTLLLGPIDLIVVGHAVPGGNVAAAVNRLRKTRVLLVTHGEEVTVYSRGARMRSLLLRALAAADVIRCTTAINAEEIRQLAPGLGGRIVVQPPPVRLSSTMVSPQAVSELRNRLGLEGKRVLLTLGRLVPRKGVDVTLRAFARIAAEFPELVYVIAGDGPYRAALEQLTEELGLGARVIFAGRVEDSALYYHLCDVFVMPNRVMPDGEREGYGIVFVEAGAAGKPVIGGRTGGTVDAINHDETGLLVDPENVEEVEGTIRELLSSPEKMRSMGEAGRVRAQKLFSPDVVARQFEEVVQMALHSNA